jgi:hypothetical protein
MQVPVSVRACRLGEVTKRDTRDECLQCASGFYSLQPDLPGGVCEPCPAHAVCDPGAGRIMAPSAGFYHSNPFSEEVRAGSGMEARACMRVRFSFVCGLHGGWAFMGRYGLQDRVGGCTCT